MQTRELSDQLRIQKLELFSKKEAEFKKRIADAEVALEQKSGASPEEHKDAEEALEIAKLDHEDFVWDHDTTGALKGERFGQHLRASLDEKFKLTRAENGELVCREGNPAETPQINRGHLTVTFCSTAKISSIEESVFMLERIS